MKTILIVTKLLVSLSCSLFALEIKWESDLPEIYNSSSLDLYTGLDGSALVYDSSSSVLYWYDSSGNMQQQIDESGYALDHGVIVSESCLLLPMVQQGQQEGVRLTKIHKKNEYNQSNNGGYEYNGNNQSPGYSTVTIPGKFSASEGNILSSYPYYVSSNESKITMYRLTEFSQSSNNNNGSKISMVPANAIVIPALHQGNVTISLESSVDMVEWKQVQPGSYSSQDAARFFRVKATAQ